MKIVNPATEEIIQDIAVDSESVLLSKLQVLQQAQLEWAKTDIESRVKIIHRFIELLKENIEALALILTSEMGKPLQQSRNEINGASGKAAWLADNAVKYLSEEIMTISDQMQEKISYEPLGVICNISAWNYPYNVGVNVFVPALLAGNAVMYKPSEFTSLTGLEIEKYLKKAGVPDGVFQVAIGQGEVGRFLLELPFDGYFFTGSYQTGNFIYEKVAEKMVPCQLELGGKDPVYVTDNVLDVKSAAIGIADGAFYNNGQSCCSVERIYVHEKVYDEFLEAFIQEVQSWKIGSPLEDGVYISPLSRASQLDFLTSQVQDALVKGAKIEVGGSSIPGVGYYFQPTVLTQVNHTMDVMKEESFGPIIGIMKVQNDQEAIFLMNDTLFGLTAGVYAHSEERASAILKQVNAGSAYWNCCDRVSAALPWSGRGHSGFGSTLSHMGLRAFTKPKAYHLRK
jgi:acyl-CoA reductase-like NAD-dependent aldehyde dehydrogenase